MLAALALASAGAVPSAHYVFYLHGRIVEDQGPAGVSPVYGAYNYAGIVDAFRRGGVTVVSEIRPRGTDVNVYAKKVAGEVVSLIKQGVPAERITVVGASKGGVIAALVSSQLRNRRVRFVLVAACNTWLARTYNPRLTGEVLSIYDTSDEIGQSCATIAKRSPDLSEFKEIALATGLGHGVVYRPLAEWMAPTIDWVKR